MHLCPCLLWTLFNYRSYQCKCCHNGTAVHYHNYKLQYDPVETNAPCSQAVGYVQMILICKSAVVITTHWRSKLNQQCHSDWFILHYVISKAHP